MRMEILVTQVLKVIQVFKDLWVAAAHKDHRVTPVPQVHRDSKEVWESAETLVPQVQREIQVRMEI